MELAIGGIGSAEDVPRQSVGQHFRARHDGHVRDHRDPGIPFDLLGTAVAALQALHAKDQEDTDDTRRHEPNGDNELLVGVGRLFGNGGHGDDARARCLQIRVLLGIGLHERHLEPLQQHPVGLRVAFQTVHPHARFVGGRHLVLERIEVLFDRRNTQARDLRAVAQRLGDLLHLEFDGFAKPLLFRFQVDHQGVTRTVLLGQLGFAPLEIRFLLAIILDEIGLEDLNGRGQSARPPEEPPRLRVVGFGLRPLDLGLGQLGIEIRNLLGDKRRLRALQEAVLLAVILDQFFRRLHLLAQVLNPLRQPRAGPPGIVEAALQAFHQIEFGQRVHAVGRGDRVFGGETDPRHSRSVQGLGAHPGDELVNDALLGDGAELRLGQIPFRRPSGAKLLTGERYADDNAHDDIFNARGDTFGRQRGIELRHLIQAQLFDDPLGKPAGLQDLDLAENGRLVLGLARQGRFEIDDGRVLGLEVNLKRGRISWRQHHGDGNRG